MKLCLLNAHTSYAPGASGSYGDINFEEYPLSCQINLIIKTILEADGIITEIFDTSSYTPYSISINQKVKLVNFAAPDACVETHFNSSPGISYGGMEVLYGVGRVDSKVLAVAVMQAMIQSLPFIVRRGNGLYEIDGKYILKAVKCPVIIPEICFLNSDHDKEFLATPTALDIIGQTLASGIKNFLGGD